MTKPMSTEELKEGIDRITNNPTPEDLKPLAEMFAELNEGLPPADASTLYDATKW